MFTGVERPSIFSDTNEHTRTTTDIPQTTWIASSHETKQTSVVLGFRADSGEGQFVGSMQP
jgi:hypothetical protein